MTNDNITRGAAQLKRVWRLALAAALIANAVRATPTLIPLWQMRCELARMEARELTTCPLS